MEEGNANGLIHPEPLTADDLRLLEEFGVKLKQGSLTETEAALYRVLTKIHDHAFRDELTGLRNRKALVHDGRKPFKRVATHRNVLYVIDINDFKQFNTVHGHQGGDTVLMHVASKISTCLRTNDGAYRYAGDEFCVLAYNVSPFGAKLLANRLWRSVRESSVRLDGAFVSVQISVGYAEIVKGVKQAFDRADRALYRAKEFKGTNHPTVYGSMP